MSRKQARKRPGAARPAVKRPARAVERTAEFDAEMIADTFGPPPAEARAAWERARRRPGRPRRGAGAQAISVSVERTLLALADQLANKMGLTRAALIERGLKAVLAAEGEI
jgi:hypothetical protein